MTDRISEIKSLLETLSLKLASELQSQREEIEELRAKVEKLEGMMSQRTQFVVVEEEVHTEEPETMEEDEEVFDQEQEDSYVTPQEQLHVPEVQAMSEEEGKFTVTDLNDVHSTPRATLSELFATHNTIADLAQSKTIPWMVDIPGPKVEMIQSALSFNDRLTFIRELFDGDSEQFNITLDRINETSTFDEVVSDMRDAYPEWDENSPLVYRFYMEVRRRYRD